MEYQKDQSVFNLDKKLEIVSKIFSAFPKSQETSAALAISSYGHFITIQILAMYKREANMAFCFVTM